MGKVQHTVTGCVPVDRSALEAYLALITTNKNVNDAEQARVEAEESRVLAENVRVEAEDSRVEVESARVEAEESRVLAENVRVEAEETRETQAGSDHTRAEEDHVVAVYDHTQAGEDHTASETATARANAAAEAAEHMVDIKRGPKGDQGNTGSSVDYPYELVNNLTTEDATKGLSAQMGVTLDGKITQLGQELGRQVLSVTKDVTGEETSTVNIIPAGTPLSVNSGKTIRIEMPDTGTVVKYWGYYINGGEKIGTGAKVVDVELSEDLETIRVAVTSPDTNILSAGTIHCKVSILGVKTDITELQERVVSIEADIENQEENIENLQSDVEEIDDKIGDVPVTTILIPLSLTGVAGMPNKSAVVGTKYSENIGGTNSYSHCVVPAVKGDKFRVGLTRSNSTNYPYYLFVCDSDDYILSRTITSGESGGYETDVVIEDNNAAKIVVGTYAKVEFFNERIYVKKYSYETDSLQEQINEIKNNEGEGSNDNVAALQGKASSQSTLNYFLKSSETSVITDIFSRVAENDANHSCLRIAVISDTHQGGTYLKRGDTSERSIEMFKRVMGNSGVDICVHCGDLSTDYGQSHDRLMGLVSFARDMFGSYNSLIVSKGNHELNSDEYVQVNYPNWQGADTYYILNRIGNKASRLHTFNVISESEWDGVTQLYKKQGDERYVTDAEFFKLVNYNIPEEIVVDANNEDGAYFYLDFDTYKVRLIVLNNYPVGNDKVFPDTELVGKQFAWLSKTALDLSAKTTPSDWAVVTVGHIAISSYRSAYIPIFTSIMSAFMNGTNVSGTYGGSDYSKDYSEQGPGKYVGNLHGHNHSYAYDDTYGFNDIGFNWSIIDYDYIGEPLARTFGIVTIDIPNRKVYDTEVNSENDREYSF